MYVCLLYVWNCGQTKGNWWLSCTFQTENSKQQVITEVFTQTTPWSRWCNNDFLMALRNTTECNLMVNVVALFEFSGRFNKSPRPSCMSEDVTFFGKFVTGSRHCNFLKLKIAVLCLYAFVVLHSHQQSGFFSYLTVRKAVWDISLWSCVYFKRVYKMASVMQ